MYGILFTPSNTDGQICSGQDSSSESPLGSGFILTRFSIRVATPYAAASIPDRIRFKIPMGLVSEMQAIQMHLQVSRKARMVQLVKIIKTTDYLGVNNSDIHLLTANVGHPSRSPQSRSLLLHSRMYEEHVYILAGANSSGSGGVHTHCWPMENYFLSDIKTHPMNLALQLAARRSAATVARLLSTYPLDVRHRSRLLCRL